MNRRLVITIDKLEGKSEWKVGGIFQINGLNMAGSDPGLISHPYVRNRDDLLRMIAALVDGIDNQMGWDDHTNG